MAVRVRTLLTAAPVLALILAVGATAALSGCSDPAADSAPGPASPAGATPGPAPAAAGRTHEVTQRPLPDRKAVFATVESANVVPARVRIGGTLADLRIAYGDKVELGQPVATVGDDKLVLQIKALDAQIAALQAQRDQARTDLARAEDLFRRGTVPKARLDDARTAVSVAENGLKARTAERAVVERQLAEGVVLAPVAGRVLQVPVTVGTVMQPGETVAQIAEGGFKLRLRVPERHAFSIRAGDPVTLEAPTGAGREEGRVVLVYPQIEDGRVVADAEVADLGDYFVGQRVRVWVAAGDRPAIVVPESFVVTRNGIDRVRLRRPDGGTAEVPVQRGVARPLPGMPDGLEILSGLAAGDVLVQP